MTNVNTTRIEKFLSFRLLPRAQAARVILAIVATGMIARQAAEAQTTFKVVHAFTAPGDGAHPSGALIRDSAGNLYGTTPFGGTVNCGTVYKIDTSGNETVLYSFTCGADGNQPVGKLVRDSKGNLYGTAGYGGNPACSFGCGTVFKLDTTGALTVLYSFTGSPDGANPVGGVIRANGNLYGTTSNGGLTFGFSDHGIVFKVDKKGHETVLYSFGSSGASDGANPYAGLIRDSAGNLYGTTFFGGTFASQGTVFKVDSSGHETILHNFGAIGDGEYPQASLIRDSAGNLYGTTKSTSGQQNCNPCGTVFEVSAGGETVLYSFTGGADGGTPVAELIRSGKTLYGTTSGGGGPGFWGVVFKLNKAGAETVLHAFTNGADGGVPESGLFRDSAGNLYGTTYWSNGSGNGNVFELSFP